MDSKRPEQAAPPRPPWKRPTLREVGRISQVVRGQGKLSVAAQDMDPNGVGKPSGQG